MLDATRGRVSRRQIAILFSTAPEHPSMDSTVLAAIISAAAGISAALIQTYKVRRRTARNQAEMQKELSRLSTLAPYTIQEIITVLTIDETGSGECVRQVR